jgi:hypothetical protein
VSDLRDRCGNRARLTSKDFVREAVNSKGKQPEATEPAEQPAE